MNASIPRAGRGPGSAVAARGGVVGVLGGMGPLATVDFLRKLIAATPAAVDQDHVPVVISNIPQVPDRARAFRGEGESPLAAMVHSGRRLAAAGVDLVVMPCNTAHLWFDELRRAVGLPMLHLVDAAVEDACALAGPHARVGLLATDATLEAGLYVKRRRRGHQRSALQWLMPTEHEIRELVMPGIAAVKASRLDDAAASLSRAAGALASRGASAVVLGCTEIPLVLGAHNTPVPVIDATAALARRAVAWSLARRHAGTRAKGAAAPEATKDRP